MGNHHPKMTLAMVFISLALLILINYLPVVKAQPIGQGSRSGETVTVEQTVVLQPDDSVNWTAKCNVANETDYKYTDYNLTWVPFLQNHSDIRGIIVHSPLPPMVYNISGNDQNLSLGTIFRLESDMIIDGVSEVWFRLPVGEIPPDATIQLRVCRISNIERFNVTYLAWGWPYFSYYAGLSLVYNLLLNSSDANTSYNSVWDKPDCWINYRTWENISVPNETSSTAYWYNFTYIKACFGLFPNEWYYVQADIYAPTTHNMTLFVSLSDFGNDGRYSSWVWADDQFLYLPCDIDFPFVCTYGMSNGITGIGARNTYRPGEYAIAMHINASIPIGQPITASNHWFNILVPMFINRSVSQYVNVDFWVSYYNSTDDSGMFYQNAVGSQNWDEFGSYEMICFSENVSAYVGEDIDHIRFDCLLWNYSSSDSTPEARAIKFWGTQRAKNWTHEVGYTDIYFTANSQPLMAGTWNYTMYERQFFVPFGYYAVDSWRWNMTNQSIIVIPINTPKTSLEISEVMQKFEAWLVKGTKNEKGLFENIVDFFKWLAWQSFELAMDIADWVLNLPVIRDFVKFALDVFNFIYGVGVWLWDKINLVFDLLEWFTYWAVRIIYSLSIVIVYMVNVFGVISINSALLNVVKTGNGRDFILAFRAGWRFILAIITLLLSLAIMAISIVSAVVPF